jgi:murein DD-endopeptidase MepM/ murein hydrolase activator NlpD
MVPPSVRLPLCALAVSAAALAVPASAQAAAGGGGAAYPGAPEVAAARCETGQNWRCGAGERLTVTGEALDGVESVAFTGGRGGRDDSFARPRRVTEDSFVVKVPEGARTGRLRVRSDVAVTRTRRSVRVPARALAQARDTASASDMVFPIRGRHDMGQGETSGFGGARNHQGHDLFAACGTPLVALTSGSVQQKAYHSAAGHYLVVEARDGKSYAYMHLRSASALKAGQSVSAGQAVGEVGDTGRASGCHLHFEEWTAPGWYTGGRAIDPLPLLERLEAAPHPHR